MARVKDATKRVNVGEGNIARLNTGKVKLDEIISVRRPSRMKLGLSYTSTNVNHITGINLSHNLSVATQVDHVTAQKLQVCSGAMYCIVLGHMVNPEESDWKFKTYKSASTSINRGTQLNVGASRSVILRRHSAREKTVAHGVEVVLLFNGVEDLKGFTIEQLVPRGSLEELKAFNCVVYKGSLH
ncbi:hypothetical protein M9H77_21607 [Catharanthus roseus]|uniref:Uncharacterized protein n=1 Tax=Catharanthus roseus TaxID=4058 RepID=A0ACC0ANY1_CATRO|nr:hypothetical protein M9H77_21607 [Catharanthus roseus]